MDAALQPYLRALQQYTSHLQLPGLDRNYEIGMADIFVQPYMQQPSTETSSPGIAANDRAGKKKRSREEESQRRPKGPPRPANELLDTERRLAVLGEAGQGKSTLLRHFASKLAAEGEDFPLLVE